MNWFSRSWWSWFGGGSLLKQVWEIQKLTTRSCGFLPTVTSALAMLTSGNATVLGISSIAKEICRAVSRNAVTLHGEGPKPEINEVIIEGEFIRQ